MEGSFNRHSLLPRVCLTHYSMQFEQWTMIDISTTQDYGSKEYTSLDRVCSDTNIPIALVAAR